jgi:putative transposase
LINVALVRLRTQIDELFNQSRGAAGIMHIVAMMQERGYNIGRFAVRGLMRVPAAVVELSD